MDLEYTSLHIDPVRDRVIFSPANTPIILLTEARQEALSKLLGIKLELQLSENVAQVTSKLQRLMPERQEGELSGKVSRILDARWAGTSNLSSLFELAAYFASNNALGDGKRMDAFLAWVFDQKYTDYLERFLQINTPTIHAFATQILKSAIRIKNIKFLTALLDYGVKFDSVLDDIFSIGDTVFMKLILSRVDSTYFKGSAAIKLFHRCISGNHFDLVRVLVQKGVSVEDRSEFQTPLYNAVSNKNIRTISLLLELLANVNSVSYHCNPDTALGKAALMKNAEIVTLLVEHGAKVSCKVAGKDLLDWASLNCRNIYNLLKEKFGSITDGVTIGDLVDAAKKSRHSLKTYICKYEGQVSTHQLEEALIESIRLEQIAATVTLLLCGVSPNCYTLEKRPLWTALDSKNQKHRLCELLIKFKANANTPGILRKVVQEADIELLQLFVISGANLAEQGMEALVESISFKNAMSAAFLLDSRVNINTPGLEMNPLQTAAIEGDLDMIELGRYKCSSLCG